MQYKPHALGWINDLNEQHELKAKFALHKVSKAFLTTLKSIESSEDQETYLKENHPILFIEALTALGRKEELSDFCKGLRDNVELFTFYWLYYLEPWFESLRQEGRLTKGQKWIKNGRGRGVLYKGELLDGKTATGKGEY